MLILVFSWILAELPQCPILLWIVDRLYKCNMAGQWKEYFNCKENVRLSSR